MVRITGYKQFPSANIVMWVMNDRAPNKHRAGNASSRTEVGLLRMETWIRKSMHCPGAATCRCVRNVLSARISSKIANTAE